MDGDRVMTVKASTLKVFWGNNLVVFDLEKGIVTCTPRTGGGSELSAVPGDRRGDLPAKIF